MYILKTMKSANVLTYMFSTKQSHTSHHYCHRYTSSQSAYSGSACNILIGSARFVLNTATVNSMHATCTAVKGKLVYNMHVVCSCCDYGYIHCNILLCYTCAWEHLQIYRIVIHTIALTYQTFSNYYIKFHFVHVL